MLQGVRHSLQQRKDLPGRASPDRKGSSGPTWITISSMHRVSL